jgi:hypothetical protein
LTPKGNPSQRNTDHGKGSVKSNREESNRISVDLKKPVKQSGGGYAQIKGNNRKGSQKDREDDDELQNQQFLQQYQQLQEL